jgi:hypothetical protein
MFMNTIHTTKSTKDPTKTEEVVEETPPPETLTPEMQLIADYMLANIEKVQYDRKYKADFGGVNTITYLTLGKIEVECNNYVCGQSYYLIVDSNYYPAIPSSQIKLLYNTIIPAVEKLTKERENNEDKKRKEKEKAVFNELIADIKRELAPQQILVNKTEEV